MYRRIEKSFDKIPQLSSRDVAYQTEDENLRKFYKFPPVLASFEQAILARKNVPVDRQMIHRELTAQYSAIDIHPKVQANLDALLDEHTFTVITAHQPSLLTGPLYFIYKICSAISLARQVNREIKGHKIVPVFILGGEDHDFDEIASIHLFGKTISWESRQKGAVGRMTIDDLRETLDTVIEMLGQNTHAEELKEHINQAYSESKTYSAFTFRLVNSLFEDYGLVIANMDKASFKRAFLPYVEKDILERHSHRLVNEDQENIQGAGFKPQAFARQVNLFLHGDDRDRIMLTEDDDYEINGQRYSTTELINLLQKEAGNISPNVILRPLFQEVIFPNLAYIGGGGEIAYWLERQSLFDEFKVPFPILIRRDSFMIVDQRSSQTMDQLGLTIDELFDREEQIINNFTIQQSETEIDLSESKNQINTVFEHIADLAKEIDPTLYRSVLGEGAKAEKIVEYLENKILKAEKRNRSTELNKIVKLKNKFFPGNDGLQERYDNFIPFFLKYGKKWINEIVDHADPLNKNFKILVEETET